MPRESPPLVGTPWRVRTKTPNSYTLIMASSLPQTSLSTKMPKRSFSDVEHDNGQEQSEVSSASDRFFVMWSEDQTRPIDKLSPFVIDKAIKCTVGTMKSIKKLRSGDFLLEVSSATQSRQMSKLKSTMDRPVIVTSHRSLNSCKGVIRCRELIDGDQSR